MGFRAKLNLSVYCILDPAVCAGRDVADIALSAAQGGVTMIQLRDKSGDAAEVTARARAVQAVLRPFGVPFILNDYVEIAAAIGADGVHIGQEDMPPEAARGIIGPAAILGVTAFTSAHMARIDSKIVDYVGTGPFYATQTKPNKPVLGAQGFTALVPLSPVPVVGIGGITPQNAPMVMRAGAAGVAMMRAISEAPDPRAAAQEFVKAVQA